jgi:hypothetical protein
MVQPFDYTLKTPSTTESFLAGVQAYQNQQKVNAAQAAAQAEQEALNREAQFTIDAQKVRQNPTSENISSLYEKYPKLGTQIKAFGDRLTEADRNTYGTILEEALRAKFNGASAEDVKKIYDTLEPLRAKNSNRNDMEKIFTDAARLAGDPNADDDFVARSYLNAIDKDAYNNLYNSTESEFAKGLRQEGLLPGTPGWADAHKRKRTEVTIQRPDGSVARGTPEELKAYFGIEITQANEFKEIFSKQQFEALKPGQKFIFNGKEYTKNAEGGQTEMPSGNFQGQ